MVISDISVHDIHHNKHFPACLMKQGNEGWHRIKTLRKYTFFFMLESHLSTQLWKCVLTMVLIVTNITNKVMAKIQFLQRGHYFSTCQFKEATCAVAGTHSSVGSDPKWSWYEGEKILISKVCGNRKRQPWYFYWVSYFCLHLTGKPHSTGVLVIH